MKVITEQAYLEIRDGAKVTAGDSHGDKVLLLADGTYLKLFRVKRLITSARIFPYWRRFEKNSLGLKELQVPTLDVIEVFRIPEIRRTAVHYHPLPGLTIREVGEIDAGLCGKLGKFIKSLHDKGVYLRSMHLGNVVLTPAGELGLIDIADMKIYPKSLSPNMRLRNFHHLCRYTEDVIRISPHLEEFIAAFDEKLQTRLKPLFTL